MAKQKSYMYNKPSSMEGMGGGGGGGGGGGYSPLHFVLSERFSCHLDSTPRMNWFGIIPASSTGRFEIGFLLGGKIHYLGNPLE